MKDPPTVNIHPAHKNDLIALARIHISALRCYKYIKVMYRAASHWNAINAMLESRYANTDYQIKIAVTGKSYCVAGWMSYSVVGDPGMPIKDSLSYVDWAAAMAFFVEDAQQSMDRTSHVKERRSEQSQRGKLSEIIRSKFVDAQWVAMNGTKYLIINALVVDRSNQSCDVFSGLLSYATEYADQEGMSMCAQIPQSEAAMFERAGFQQFSSFELDLEHYTQSNSKQSFETLVSQVFIFLVRRARHRLT